MAEKSEQTYFKATFYWIFGVCTCAFYAVSTLQVCSQESGMLALFWPLLLIPAANVAALLFAKSGVSPRTFAVLSAMNGVACAVSILLTIVLSPLCMLACFGLLITFAYPPALLFCGYHLLVALGPIFTSFAMRRRLLALKAEQRAPWMPMGTAAAVTLGMVLLAVFPSLLTAQCLAAANNDLTRKQSVLLLRAFGDNETMLRSCYDQNVVLPWWFSFAQGITSSYDDDESTAPRQRARENYYRATGVPFNSMKRPQGTKYYYDWDDEIDWWDDHDFAGATVGGIVRGLTLTKSQIDGWVDPNECVSHMSWNMRIQHNTNSRAELRAEIILPPQAVVSACSLWIDGVRHDAIIGTRTSTRKAYQSSAQNGERPFMVSTAGPGRVLIQSSTGWWSKDVDLNLEITAPTTVMQEDLTVLRLPVFAERNFAVTATHMINILDTRSGAKQVIKDELSDAAIHSAKGTINLHRNAEFVKVRASVPYFSEGTELVEHLQVASCDNRVPVFVVLDGSSSMAPYIDSVCRSLSAMNFSDATLVWASDNPQTVVSHVSSKSLLWQDAVSRLHDAGCVGGQDNAAALVLTLKALPAASSSNVVWIHGPQPAKLSGDKLPEALADSRCRLFEYQVMSAPNELIRSLDHSPNLVQVANLKSTEADLNDLFGRMSGARPVIAMEGSIEAASKVQAIESKHPNELAQVFINQLILNKLGEEGKREELGALAQKAHLVTPLTSALVLEQKSDYERYNVKQYGKSGASASSVSPKQGPIANPSNFVNPLIPIKPEPPMGVLLACAMLIMAGMAWIKRRFVSA
jgi:hypothetical protein